MAQACDPSTPVGDAESAGQGRAGHELRETVSQKEKKKIGTVQEGSLGLFAPLPNMTTLSKYVAPAFNLDFLIGFLRPGGQS